MNKKLSGKELKKELNKIVECPLCLFGSGILADGKGTTCKICGGGGKVNIRVLKEFNENLEIK